MKGVRQPKIGRLSKMLTSRVKRTATSSTRLTHSATVLPPITAYGKSEIPGIAADLLRPVQKLRSDEIRVEMNFQSLTCVGRPHSKLQRLGQL